MNTLSAILCAIGIAGLCEPKQPATPAKPYLCDIETPAGKQAYAASPTVADAYIGSNNGYTKMAYYSAIPCDQIKYVPGLNPEKR